MDTSERVQHDDAESDELGDKRYLESRMQHFRRAFRMLHRGKFRAEKPTARLVEDI